MPKPNIQGKTILLTGIGGGIGCKTAERLMNEGGRLIGISSREKKALPETIKNNKNLLDILTCDLGNLNQVEAMCRLVETNYHCPDIIINNAAQFDFKILEDLNHDEILKGFNINIIAPIINYFSLMNHALIIISKYFTRNWFFC